MGKLLKVLVVFIFLFSIGALVLSVFNFRKREMLIGRAHELEERIIQLARTIEERDPAFDGVPDHPDRDIDQVTDRIIDVPQTSDFWDSYNNVLEVTGTPTLNLSTERSRLQLRQYYYVDELGKIVPDPLTGAPRREGPGTMDELLDQVQERANAQYARLNRTRDELIKVRRELSTTIRDLNNEKRQRRQNLRRITELEGVVRRLEGDKSDLQRQIAQLEREKRELNDQITALRNDLALERENFESLQRQYAELQKRYDDLTRPDRDPVRDRVSMEAESRLSPGRKGRVVHADRDWAFVIVQLTDSAANELIGEDQDLPAPVVDFMVQREGLQAPAGSFVTRIRIKSVKRDGSNLAIADNLTNWEQVPVAVGDEVFF